ncbi:MAG: ACP S-malonyltransferase [Defluviitaleaceae bacterium]|nr:ACP S-malonyltransferase [Defluviitaleaceae bacterium]
MRAFLFPGQGSQKKGMGAELFEAYPMHVEIADRVLGYSIKELCLKNLEDKLNFTEYTQVAIFVVNALTYLHYIETKKLEPDFVAGHSLGEYNALLAAKVFDFETGLKLVHMRGQLMGKVSGGGMAAVLGFSGEHVEAICREYPLLSISVANYNTNIQTIIVGERENIMKSRDIFTALGGVKFLPLNVSGAFHSSYMMLPKIEFEKYISQFELKKPQIPIISNLTAREYKGDTLSSYLVDQIDSPVRWNDTVKYLLDKGVQHFIELGQSTMLTRMIESIRENYAPTK